MKRKTIFMSILTIIMCLSLMVGGTFALFTSESKVNIAVTSGKINVTATIDQNSVETKQLYDTAYKAGVNNMYEGVATFNEDGLTLEKFVPGDGIKFNIVVKNESKVTVKYRTIISCENDNGLFAGLSITVGDELNYSGVTLVSNWAELAVGSENEIVPVTIELPETAGNTYQEKTCTISYKVEAVQGNAKTFDDTWDGTADTSWYNENDTVFSISTAEEFAGFAKIAGTDDFAGKTLLLDADIDLGLIIENGEYKSFEPIGTTGERDSRGRLVTTPFKGTFDGQKHTISNLHQSGWDFGYEWGQYGSIGLFSKLEGATIKNVTISGTDAQVEGGDIGGICGSAEGTCVFENITIEDTTLGTYNNGIGGIIGWSGTGEYTFKNITISEDVVLGGLWGSFDSSIGGVVGQAEPGATYNFDNVNVACRLDAYNDVTAAYQYYLYRMTGMLIGRCEETTTINDSNYPDLTKYNITCTNVTVTYGDWMNYHYCYGFKGARYTRVEAGYAYGGLDVNAEGHMETCTDHMLCLPFVGLFGGDQYGVRTITEYEGVTVKYPDSYVIEE